VLTDFNKLPVYFWSCEPNGDESIRILFVEPFVITLGVNSLKRVNSILDVHMVPKPPRREVLELMMRVVNNSKWMFGPGDTRIVNFTEDKPADSWAKSLKCLPPMSGLESKDEGRSVVPKISTEAGAFQLIPANAPFFVKQSVQRITKREDLENCQ
jgi:hypothetical protein